MISETGVGNQPGGPTGVGRLTDLAGASYFLASCQSLWILIMPEN